MPSGSPRPPRIIHGTCELFQYRSNQATSNSAPNSAYAAEKEPTRRGGISVLVDGFIVSVAALTASHINPSCRPYLLFSHASAEQGHHLVLQALEARPLLDLDLRLGEGSGAALALPILRLACALHNRMATFAEAAVPGRA
jgi:NaMN:DMB phosphoribosyltransferase